MRKRGKKNAFIGLDMVAWIVLGAALVALSMIAYFYAKRTGISIVDRIKELIFGR